ncbi:MerR family DNA-binding transcriptional regulator [Streptomyces sp. NPDC005970]|uniref:MerR family transcriptional regulator n=1 Tax=Streptomyces sp. NPDC005970 TaxID=3156723 RepID=UPI00340F48EC
MVDKQPMKQLTIGELARITGVATSALRYWEELGLVPIPSRPGSRANGGTRLRQWDWSD